MSDVTTDVYEREQAIRKRIMARFENRAEFITHLVTFVITMSLLWFVLQPIGLWYLLAQLCTGFWAIGIFIHGTQTLFKELSERAIQREIELERATYRYDLPDKRKRSLDDLSIVVDDDGELDPGYDYYDEDDMQHYSGQA